MSILVDENTTFIIQGITGREASCHRTMNGAAWGRCHMPQLSSCGGAPTIFHAERTRESRVAQGIFAKASGVGRSPARGTSFVLEAGYR